VTFSFAVSSKFKAMFLGQVDMHYYRIDAPYQHVTRVKALGAVASPEQLAAFALIWSFLGWREELSPSPPLVAITGVRIPADGTPAHLIPLNTISASGDPGRIPFPYSSPSPLHRLDLQQRSSCPAVTLWRILPESGTTGQDSDDLPVPYHTGDESCLSAPIQCPPILDPLDDD
jgi:hypothetical protein